MGGRADDEAHQESYVTTLALLYSPSLNSVSRCEQCMATELNALVVVLCHLNQSASEEKRSKERQRVWENGPKLWRFG